MRLRDKPQRAAFSASWAQTRGELHDTLAKLSVGDYLILTPGVRNGQHLDSRKDDPAVTLRYRDDDEDRDVEVTVNAYGWPGGNLRAIYLAMESRRMNMVRGVDEAVQQTYLALPAPLVDRDPYEVLGVRPDSGLDFIEDVYAMRAKRAHPDTGGSEDEMSELNKAIAKIRDELGAS